MDDHQHLLSWAISIHTVSTKIQCVYLYCIYCMYTTEKLALHYRLIITTG